MILHSLFSCTISKILLILFLVNSLLGNIVDMNSLFCRFLPHFLLYDIFHVFLFSLPILHTIHLIHLDLFLDHLSILFLIHYLLLGFLLLFLFLFLFFLFYLLLFFLSLFLSIF